MTEVKRRVRRAGLLATALFVALGARVAWLQVGPGDAHAASAWDNALRERRVVPPRGRILDRRGELLADTRPSVDLVVRPSDVPDPAALREALSRWLEPTSIERLDEALAATGLERHRAWTVARDLDGATLAKVASHRHLLAGTELEASQLRTYTAEPTAPHLVGYLSEAGPEDLLRLDPDRYRAGDQIGRLGLEQIEEPRLRGVPGRDARLVDTLGRPVHGSGPWYDALEEERRSRQQPAIAGSDVHLTLDAAVQREAIAALDGRPGAAVMLDVHTGAVLAYASAPVFDPGELVRGVPRSRWRELGTDPTKPLLDRVVRGLYPPASTFKVATAAAALEAGISADLTVSCGGSYQVGRRRFRCWKRGGHGMVDLVGALRGSCDVWFYKVGLELGPEPIADAARRLGLGPPTGFGLNGERGGLLPSPDWMRRRHGLPWSIGDTASASIGQGINQATPLQLAVMTASIANGGSRVTPWVVDRVVEPDGVTRQLGGARPPEPTGFDAAVLAPIRAGLEAVVMDEHGTAHRSRIEGMPYAGKTGTAQVVSAELKALRPGRETEDHALFVAYAPLEAPRVAVAVVVEHAGGGSANAAPVAKRMLEVWARGEGLIAEPEPETEPEPESVP